MSHNLSKQALDNLFLAPSVFKMPAPQAVTTTGTLTTTELLGGVLTVDGGASGTTTQTTPTGTQIDAAFTGRLQENDAFDLYVINISTQANDNMVLAMGTGVTLVGNNDVEEEDAVANASSGQFRFRKTADNTFSCYRLA